MNIINITHNHSSFNAAKSVREQLKVVKELIGSGNDLDAYQYLLKIADPSMDYSQQFKLAKLLSDMAISKLKLKPLKVALISSNSIDHFSEVLKLWLAIAGYDATLFISTYNTVFQTILDPDSDLYTFNPDYVWIICGYRDYTVNIPPGSDKSVISAEISNARSHYETLCSTLRKYSGAYILLNNADIPIERNFGNLAGAIHWGSINCLRKLNLELDVSKVGSASIFDIDTLSSIFGKQDWFDDRFWYHSKHSFSMDAYGLVASRASWLIKAAEGKSKKCIVLDLDNTLWGGVIGDDGVDGIVLGMGALGEAYVDFQKYILGLKNRGIILAVCSKNDEENAKSPFLSHPDMCLSLEDIAIFVANWQNKADNIRFIAHTLNIGLDSIVFIDDNPAEREQVSKTLPMVAVPDIPNDPTAYINTIHSYGYFESISFTSEDSQRNTMYKQNIKRQEFECEFTDLSSFLESLKMTSEHGEINQQVLPRVTQLINKSNQFHLTTTRYSEAEIKSMTISDKYITRYFTLSDKFGENGVISVIILKRENDTLAIDTWVMSCRVLSRGMEIFIHQQMIEIAKQNGINRLVGVYIPSGKNRLVKDLYETLGFTLLDDTSGTTTWEFLISSQVPKSSKYIQSKIIN